MARTKKEGGSVMGPWLALQEALAQGTGPYSEPAAQLFGKGVTRGASQQRYPLHDYLMLGRGREEAISGLAQELRSVAGKAPPQDPQTASRILLDFLEGKFHRQRALSNISGDIMDIPYGPPPVMSAAEQMAVQAPYAQTQAAGDIWSALPNVDPWMEALAGYNVAARGGYQTAR
jgi:hypothetical protein